MQRAEPQQVPTQRTRIFNAPDAIPRVKQSTVGHTINRTSDQRIEFIQDISGKDRRKYTQRIKELNMKINGSTPASGVLFLNNRSKPQGKDDVVTFHYTKLNNNINLQITNPVEHTLSITTTESQNIKFMSINNDFESSHRNFTYYFNNPASSVKDGSRVLARDPGKKGIIESNLKNTRAATLSRGRRTDLQGVIQQDTSTEMFFQSRNKKVQKDITRNRQKISKKRMNGKGTSKVGGRWVEYDFDEGTSTTTKDPSLPENPVGLRNPNLLVGPWVEEPTVRKSKARFGWVHMDHIFEIFKITI